MLGLGDSFFDDHVERLGTADAAAALETGRRLLDAGSYVLVVVENKD